MLFILVFAVLVAMSFGTMAVLLRPGKEQKVIEKRLSALLSTGPPVVVLDDSVLRVAEPRTPDQGFIQQALRGTGIPVALNRLVLQAAAVTTVERLLLTMTALAVAAGAFAYLFSRMFWVAGIAAIIFGWLPVMRLQFRRSRRVKAFEKALPECVELCARSLRAGHSLVGAIGQVAEESEQPAREEFAEVFRKQNYGLPLRDALLELLERVPSADLRVAVTGILVQKDTGGNLAEIMDRISEVIRERVRIKGEIGVHTAQGRLTGYILCLLPVFLLLAINIMSPGYSKVLFHDEAGQELLGTGVVLLAFGWFLIRRIINGIEV